MIEYRSFRNDDPPRVAEAWTLSLSGPRTVAIPARATTLLEYFLLAKPYFDPAGLILAQEEGRLVGFLQTGFVSNASGNGLDTSVGIVCALGVIPDQRRKGIGSELLRHAETYMRGRGAKRVIAGAMTPENPFGFGLYGGCDSPGILSSNAAAQSFFEKHGYTLARRCEILQRSLGANLPLPADSRFLEIRQQFEIIGSPRPAKTWWTESVLGPIEVFEYALCESRSEKVVGRMQLWDMELYAHAWKQSCVGLLDFQIEQAWRRRGLGSYLLFQVLRHLSEQTFGLIETRLELENAAAMGFFTRHGLARVESGSTYQRDLT